MKSLKQIWTLVTQSANPMAITHNLNPDPIDPMTANPKEFKAWAVPKIRQLPDLPVLSERFDYTQSDLNMLMDLKRVLSQPDLYRMQEALTVARVTPKTQPYVDYFQGVFDQIETFKDNYPAIVALNQQLLQFEWPQNIQLGVKKFHADVLPALQSIMQNKLSPALQAKFQANYQTLMASYDLKQWTRLALDTYHADWQIQQRRSLSSYLNRSFSHHDLTAFNTCVDQHETLAFNLINPLLLHVHKQLVGNLFADRSAIPSLKTKLAQSPTAKAVINWFLLAIFSGLSVTSPVTWSTLTQPQITWSKTNYAFDDQKLVRDLVLTSFDQAPMKYEMGDTLSFELPGQAFQHQIPMISELQAAYQRLLHFGFANELFRGWPRFIKKTTLVDDLDHHQNERLQFDPHATWSDNIDADLNLNFKSDLATDAANYTQYLQVTNYEMDLCSYYRLNSDLDVIVSLPAYHYDRYFKWLWDLVQHLVDGES